MARQVVPYDDLDAPSGLPMQSSVLDPISGAYNESTAQNDTVPTSPPSKKRRRDDEVNTTVEATISHDLEEVMTNSQSFENEASENVNTPPFPALPPKPQVKKRGKKKRNLNGSAAAAMTTSTIQASVSFPVKHWDDPGMQADRISYDEAGGETSGTGLDQNPADNDEGDYGECDMSVEETEDDEDDESRELTHEEIWDDSALIDAWNAATEEYEVCGHLILYLSVSGI